MEQESSFLDVVRGLKSQDPFEPFLIVMTSGDRHLIESGDLVVVSKRQVIYCHPKSDRVVFMDRSKIAGVEHPKLIERQARRRKAG